MKFYYHLLLAKVVKNRASEIKTILQADLVAKDFIAGNLRVREAITAARKWRRDQRLPTKQKTTEDLTPQISALTEEQIAKKDAQTAIVTATKRVIELMVEKLEPDKNVYSYAGGLVTLRFCRSQTSPQEA